MPHKLLHRDDFLIGAVHTGLDVGVDNPRTVKLAKRIISGLEDVPSFDELIVEVAPPAGFQRTQAGLLVPAPRGRD